MKAKNYSQLSSLLNPKPKYRSDCFQILIFIAKILVIVEMFNTDKYPHMVLTSFLCGGMFSNYNRCYKNSIYSSCLYPVELKTSYKKKWLYSTITSLIFAVISCIVYDVFIYSLYSERLTKGIIFVTLFFSIWHIIYLFTDIMLSSKSYIVIHTICTIIMSSVLLLFKNMMKGDIITNFSKHQFSSGLLLILFICALIFYFAGQKIICTSIEKYNINLSYDGENNYEKNK